MFVNAKYFVITIGAIFLALGVGIMLGFNLNNSEIFSKQQIELIEDMDKKLNQLRDENEDRNQEISELKLRLDSDHLFIDTYYKEIIQDKLLGRSILLIQTTEDYFFYDINYLTEIGKASIVNHVILDQENITWLDLDKLEAITGVRYESKPAVINELAVNALLSNNMPLIQFLEESGVLKIQIRGDGKVIPTDVIMLNGDIREDEVQKAAYIDQVLSPVINATKTFGIAVYAVEESSAIHSLNRFYKKNNLSSVTNIDTSIGKTSLIYIMNGIKGNFGDGKDADGRYPKSD